MVWCTQWSSPEGLISPFYGTIAQIQALSKSSRTCHILVNVPGLQLFKSPIMKVGASGNIACSCSSVWVIARTALSTLALGCLGTKALPDHHFSTPVPIDIESQATPKRLDRHCGVSIQAKGLSKAINPQVGLRVVILELGFCDHKEVSTFILLQKSDTLLRRD